MEKIYLLQIDKADFVKTRWLFNWDESKAPAENIPGALGELEALKDLRQQGVVDLLDERNEANPTKTKFRELADYQISQTKFYRPDADKAYLWFDWCAWITGLDYEKFAGACRDNGFQPNTGATEAYFSLESFNIPVVAINGMRYKMKMFRSGHRPEEIVLFCLDDKSGKLVTLDDLLDKGILSRPTNLNQVFAKTQFGSRNALSPFVTIRPDRIKVSRQAILSPEQQAKIIAVSSDF